MVLIEIDLELDPNVGRISGFSNWSRELRRKTNALPQRPEWIPGTARKGGLFSLHLSGQRNLLHAVAAVGRFPDLFLFLVGGNDPGFGKFRIVAVDGNCIG